jgi:hypothetical protein
MYKSYLYVFKSKSCVSQSQSSGIKHTLRVEIALVRVIIKLWLLKSHFACKNYTCARQNLTRASKNHTLHVEITLVRVITLVCVNITLCVHKFYLLKSHSYLLKSYSECRRYTKGCGNYTYACQNLTTFVNNTLHV